MPVSVSQEPMLEPGKLYQFGEPRPESSDFLFSNDGPVPKEAVDALQGTDHGMSLHIGAGTLIALMPYHDLQPVIVDRNPSVIQMNQLVVDSILNTNNVTDAYDRIAADGELIVRRLPKPDESVANVADNLKADASMHRLGGLHWSNHFHEVKAALQDRPPIHVISDLREPSFILAMRQASATHGLIRLFNPTNVHQPKYQGKESMDFVRNLPFDVNVLVLMSLSGAIKEFFRGRSLFYSLERTWTKGISEYLALVEESIKTPGASARELKSRINLAKMYD